VSNRRAVRRVVYLGSCRRSATKGRSRADTALVIIDKKLDIPLNSENNPTPRYGGALSTLEF